MEYVYATLMLNETGEEINENNLTATLEAAGASVTQSRVKALVAALEDVDIDDLARQAGIATEVGADPARIGGDAEPSADDGDPAEAEASAETESADAPATVAATTRASEAADDPTADDAGEDA